MPSRRLPNEDGMLPGDNEGQGVLCENDDDVYCTTYDDLVAGEARMEQKVRCTLLSFCV